MSRYAWLVCEDTKRMIWLGKIVQDETSGHRYFRLGNTDHGPESGDHLLKRAVMKFLADHIGMALRVWPEEMLDRQITDEYTEIGGNEPSDISLEEYVQDYRL